MLNEERQTPLSVIDATGRQINLLNDNGDEPSSPQSYSSDEPITWSRPNNSTNNQNDSLSSFDSKRKYHCSEVGCNKSFTTSGHLARHHRIHTGEKNFPCLFPGCQSRFSRQDNMMQHYRTHMSPKSRRTMKRPSEESHPRPKLHAHHRIRSDPYQLDPPLTIDQHISNYHRSLAPPLKSIVYRQSSISPQLSQPLPPSTTTTATPSSSSIQNESPQFYKHRPLVYPHTHTHSNSSHSHSSSSSSSSSSNSDGAGRSHSSFTLLHPPPVTPDSSKKDSKQDSLLQLAHIVSTFG